MKRFTLSMSLLSAVASMFAAEGTPQEIVYGYCGEPKQSIGTPWQEYTSLVEFPEDFVKRFNGAEIVAVQIASPDNFDDPTINDFIDIDLCFYTEKGGDPFYSQAAQLSDKAFDWKQIDLESPVKIEEGKPFYVGYAGIAPNIDSACFAVDFQFNSDDLGMWLGWEDPISGEMVWDSYSQDYGNLCLRLVINGDELPSDEVTLEWMFAPNYTFTGKPFDVNVTVINNAANEIKSLEFDYTVEGVTNTAAVDVVPPLQYNEMREIDVPGIVCSEIGNRVPMTMKIKSVNGNEEAAITDNFNEPIYIYSIPEGIGYERNVVVEEGTGTWCGYCPMGIVGMEYMNETYNDGTFIPIAIHGNDKMQSRTYIKIAEEYFTGYPSAIVNRDMARFGAFSPEAEVLEIAYKMSRSIPAFAEISMEANFADDEHSAIEINTASTFAIATEDSYSVAFGITQNNVGPYDQTNYYADNAEGPMGGWENKPDPVSTYYNDVARGYYVAGEIGNTPGEEHKLSYTLPLDFLKEDKDNFTLVAMVINNVTGDIENAVMMKSGAFSAVSKIENPGMTIQARNGVIEVCGGELPVSIYSSDGRLIHSQSGDCSLSLPSGLYIVKSGATTKKIML